MFLYQIENCFLELELLSVVNCLLQGIFLLFTCTQQKYTLPLSGFPIFISYFQIIYYILCTFVDKQPLGHVLWWQGLGE